MDFSIPGSSGLCGGLTGVPRRVGGHSTGFGDRRLGFWTEAVAGTWSLGFGWAGRGFVRERGHALADPFLFL